MESEAHDIEVDSLDGELLHAAEGDEFSPSEGEDPNIGDQA